MPEAIQTTTEPTARSQEPRVDPARARRSIEGRFNPVRNFTPQTVVRNLDRFRAGYLRDAAWLMEVVEEQDDALKVVAGKRKSAISRLPWDVVPVPDAEDLGATDKQIDEQINFLQRFFNRLEARHALERDQRGGLGLLIRQMMDAVGKKYAAHEIQWTPAPDGNLSARLVFTPLWFFEAITGELRFLAQEFAAEGEPRMDNQWMVTVGPGLMVASLIAYTYKTLPLKDWLTYSERNGMPFVSVATDAKPDSADWNAAVTAAGEIAAEYAAVHTRNSEFQVHDLTAKGELPYPKLVERMDRFMATLWRGSDLSTMSGKDQLGASAQQSESDIILEDDVDLINDTLNHWLVTPALQWKFGPDAARLACFRLKAPDHIDEKAEQEKMHLAAQYGLRIPVADYRERLNLPGAGDDADEPEYLTAPAPAVAEGGEGRGAKGEGVESVELGAKSNAGMRKAPTLADALEAKGDDFKAFHAILDRLEATTTPMQLRSILEELENKFESLALDALDGNQLALALQGAAADALLKGALLEGRKLTQRDAGRGARDAG